MAVSQTQETVGKESGPYMEPQPHGGALLRPVGVGNPHLPIPGPGRLSKAESNAKERLQRAYERAAEKRADRIAEKVAAEAENGSIAHTKELNDRVIGAVTQKVEVKLSNPELVAAVCGICLRAIAELAPGSLQAISARVKDELSNDANVVQMARQGDVFVQASDVQAGTDQE